MPPTRVLTNDYDGPDRRNGGSENPILVWARAISIVGVSGAIAIMFTWFLMQELPKISRQTQINNQEILNNRTLIEGLRKDLDKQIRVMEWLCSGVQKSEADKRDCFEQ